jgi:hypothetical protein
MTTHQVNVDNLLRLGGQLYRQHKEVPVDRFRDRDEWNEELKRRAILKWLAQVHTEDESPEPEKRPAPVTILKRNKNPPEELTRPAASNPPVTILNRNRERPAGVAGPVVTSNFAGLSIAGAPKSITQEEATAPAVMQNPDVPPTQSSKRRRRRGGNKNKNKKNNNNDEVGHMDDTNNNNNNDNEINHIGDINNNGTDDIDGINKNDNAGQAGGRRQGQRRRRGKGKGREKATGKPSGNDEATANVDGETQYQNKDGRKPTGETSGTGKATNNVDEEAKDQTTGNPRGRRRRRRHRRGPDQGDSSEGP